MLSEQGYQLLDEPLRGAGANPLAAHARLPGLVTHPRLASLPAYAVGGVPFGDYLAGAAVGYDPAQRELIAANPAYPYCYALSLRSGAWAARAERYSGLLSDYPKLYGLREAEGSGAVVSALYALSREDSSPAAQQKVFFQSRPLRLRPEGLAKLQRMVVRGYTSTSGDPSAGSLLGLYLFASLDGLAWAPVDWRELHGQARDAAQLRGRFSARFYILVGSGTIRLESYLTGADVQAEAALGGKIR
jgi:hypothetical protein